MDQSAMYKLSYGLFVATAREGDKMNGCIVNTAVQVASNPNCISVAINKMNLTHDMVMRTGILNISVLSEKADFAIFKHFGFQSGKDVNKFADGGFVVAYKVAENGVPVIVAGTNAYLCLKVKETVDLGSHTLFITAPTDMQVISDVPSCTYAYYQEHIKAKNNASAGDVAKAEVPEGQHVYRCKVCGYEYVGELLPEDFICPTCKHGAEDFEVVK